MREGATMKKLLPWIIAAALLLVVAFFLGIPRLARVGGLGAGSRKYARQWREQLLACQSLEEVKQHFNCFVLEHNSKIYVTEKVAGRPWALLKSFPDGRWIACAHADSHSQPGGGTVVSRDSSGEIHIFFGHVCGTLPVRGETLEDFYRHLRGLNDFKEVFLK
jgi:hypothetical protein